jgi:alpha-L-fucosidase
MRRLQHAPSLVAFLLTALISISALALPAARPTAQQRTWQDLQLGLFIHFAPNTWQQQEYDDPSTPLSAINPERLDTEQWAETALRMGAKYLVFVARHTGGFCMWQTRTTDYSLRHTPWRNGAGDVMADLAQSCRKRGIRLGVYLSPQDKKHGVGNGGRCATRAEQEKYDATYRQQLIELLAGYGKMVEVWFDGGAVAPVGDILRKHAPEAMIFQGPHATIRWVGNETGFAPYPAWNSLALRDAKTGIATALHGDPDGEAWLPNEVVVSLRRPNWFWSATSHKNMLTLDQLMEVYYASVGRGCNLLLNASPDPTGLIPEADVARLREFGDEIRRRFAESVAETSGRGNIVELKLSRPVTVDHAVLMEDTRFGERVREYALEGKSGEKWITLGAGTAISHHRLQPFAPRELSAIRLRVTRAAAAPVIRRLAVFATNTAPPKSWNEPAKVWADDEAGTWTGGEFELDLTKKIDAATQYRLRFVPQSGSAFAVSRIEVRLNGIAQPQLVRAEAKRRDSFILTIPGLSERIQLSGSVQGAQSGTILMQKL